MVRLRFLRLMMLIPLVMTVAALALGKASIPAAFAVMIAAVLLWAFFAFAIVCPVCAKSPFLWGRKTPEGRYQVEYSSPVAEKICSKCGHDFCGEPHPKP